MSVGQRKKARTVDYLRVYPGLNDFGDALEAIPLEIVRHLTHLKEIEAKSGDTMPSLTTKIREFLKHDPAHKPNMGLLRGQLMELMPWLEEKMQVASLAAEAMDRYMLRLDTDFDMIRTHEIPVHVQIDPEDPALSEIKVPAANHGSTRTGARREAIAAKKAAAAERAAQIAASSAVESSRATTPVSRTRGRGRTATPLPPAPVVQPPSEAPITHQNFQSYPGGATTSTPTPAQPSEPPALVADDDDVGRGNSALKRRRESNEPTERRRMPDEPTYCYCNQGSYGDMVACDGPDCQREWFHLGCIGLTAPPKGQWFCEDCQAAFRRR